MYFAGDDISQPPAAIPATALLTAQRLNRAQMVHINSRKISALWKKSFT